LHGTLLYFPDDLIPPCYLDDSDSETPDDYSSNDSPNTKVAGAYSLLERERPEESIAFPILEKCLDDVSFFSGHFNLV
jgi:hypothetical protein